MVLMAITGGLGCHDTDTRAFTPSGIKKYSELKAGDSVFGCDKGMNIVETKIREVFEYDYHGKMLRLLNKHNYSMMITPSHSVPFVRKGSNSVEYVKAESLEGALGNIPSSFGWKGKGHFFHVGSRVFNPENFLKLVAWYICDGNIWELKKKNIKYFQIRKPKHQRRISNILKSFGIRHSCYNYPEKKDMGKVVVFDSGIALWLEENCGRYSKNKRIPKEILQFPKPMLRILFNEMIMGDGMSYNNGKSCRFYSSSLRLIENFIELTLKCGYGANYVCRGIRKPSNSSRIRQKIPSYEVGIQKNNNKGYFNGFRHRRADSHPENMEAMDYSGKVWCFRTGTGNFFIERDGIISLSGNSGKTLSACYLGVRNLLQNRRIFSNFHLKYEHTYIQKPEEIDTIRKGVFLGDELWAWLDARCSPKAKNRYISKILLKSRKRGYEIIYTLQDFSQIDKRVRRITDFIAVPLLYPNNEKCLLRIYDRQSSQLVRTLQFKPRKYWHLYDTAEEIEDYEDEDEED